MRIFDLHHGVDFLTGVEEIDVPVGLRFVDVKVRAVIERDFERAGLAHVPSRSSQPVLEFAAFLARESGVFELFEDFVDFFFRQFRRGEQNELLACLARDVEKGTVIGAALGIPGDDGETFERSGMAAEHGEIGVFEVVEDFAFECFEIQIHNAPISQNQNSTGSARRTGMGSAARTLPRVK